MLRKIRHRLEFVAFVAAHRLIRLLPHRAASQLGRVVGATALRFGNHHRLMVDSLERAFPERPLDEIRAIASRSARNLGGALFEEVSSLRFDPAEFAERFEIEGWHHIEELQRTGQGFLVISGHFGPFDLAGYPLAQRLGTVNVVVQERSNPYTRTLMNSMQERIGAHLIPRHRAGAKLLTLLRKGEPAALAIDQRVRPWDGILIPFLGRFCWTSPVPALLCRRAKCPAVPIFCERRSDDGYRLLVREPIWPRDLGDDPTYELTLRHHQAIEKEIRRLPDCWFWVHDRWRLTWRHSYAKSLERLRRESGLPAPVAGSPEVDPLARTLDRWVSEKLLEETANLAVIGPDDERRRAVVRAAGWKVAERGYAVRYSSLTDLAGQLAEADENGELAVELRKLDSFALLILDGELGAIEANPKALAALLHRRPRGSVLLSTPHLDEAWSNELRPRHLLEV